MKAMVQISYGSPEVIIPQEIEKPSPGKKEILIRIHAAKVGPSDCAFRKGDPFMIKLLYGLSRPKFAIGGTELAGEVEAVGKEVKHFKAGDRVLGMSVKNFGAYAEYKCLSEESPLAVIPDNIAFEEAVGVCDGGATALTFLRDKAELRKGQKVLINGASGAVGIYAVQLAKYYGAEVTGVCRTSVDVLMEKNIGEDKMDEILQSVRSIPEVKRVDRIRAREHGHYIIVDVRVGIPAELSVQEGHDISRKIKRTIQEHNTLVKEVLVHLNPWYKESSN